MLEICSRAYEVFWNPLQVDEDRVQSLCLKEMHKLFLQRGSSYAQCGNLKIFPPQFFAKISSNQFFILYINLTKTFYSGENFRNYHTVLCYVHSVKFCENFCHWSRLYVKSIWTLNRILIFWKTSAVFTIFHQPKMISRKKWVTDILSVLWKHSVEKWKIYSHWKKNSSNQLFCNFFHKFFAKKMCGKREILSHQIFFREIKYLVTSLVKTLPSRHFCHKSVRA